ncbi:MAG: YgiQ family radical SAM protein [Thermodesulfobacteriota bacterium]
MKSGKYPSLFLPCSRIELGKQGISRPDVILVSGDAYIDSPYCGVAVIGRVLQDAGFSVGIIPQPDLQTGRDICAWGEPRLFWGVSGGCVDSEVANYTALGKPRRSCDFTPGCKNTRRPDRALIAYTNLIRRFFKATVPIVLGGLEASLRRIAHYDLRKDNIRRSVLLDSKADLLVYGMGERPALQIARVLDKGRGLQGIPGTCEMGKEVPEGYLRLPAFEEVQNDPGAFAEMFRQFYVRAMQDHGPGLAQAYGNRYLLQHPPAGPMTRSELDHIQELPFMHDAHPDCKAKGEIKALQTIQDSIVTHRGCYGECSFCSIAVHQGRRIISRSRQSILREAERMASSPGFKGVLKDVGGPTANMYASGCKRLNRGEPCLDRSCIGYQGICPELKPGHKAQMRLLQDLEALPGVKRVQVASGVRHDLVLADRSFGRQYLEQLLKRHVSGQLKIAPEHSKEQVLELMNKPAAEQAAQFVRLFEQVCASVGKRLYLSCYVIAAHPGCKLEDMRQFLEFAKSRLHFVPQQVQIFTPLPCTRSTVMYHSGLDPVSGREVSSERGLQGKKQQKEVLFDKASRGRKGRGR